MTKISSEKPQMTKKAKRSGRDTRQEIIDISSKIFSEVGYNSASMRDISEEVGIKPPSLYAHFSSKNQILYTVVKDASIKLNKGCIQSVNEASDTPFEQLVAFTNSHVEIEMNNREIIPLIDRHLFRESKNNAGLNQDQQEELKEIQRELVTLLQDILNRGKADGTMRFNDLSVTTFAIFGIIEHVAYWYNPAGRLPPEETAREITGLVLKLVVPESERQKSGHL